ncbi:hypothetical protein [Microbulbifer celer]|uniref:Cell division protein FtsL n=1 Tax=Microbulbifer celer TaxID=435905 RepID=A0ABW3UEB8_9GAMM|nr:hypothetical protein [Microbulbifer celer]UFN58995.1 hypothetical protein LPW13_08170 [Microbulbifer celer]
MRNFSLLVVIVLAFGTAAVLYEKESRKVKGVLSQLTDLQAQMGDMQAEINRLSGELEAVRLAERRRPNLNAVASRVLQREIARSDRASGGSEKAPRKLINGLRASDVTSVGPAIRSRDDEEDDSDWSKPTVDAEEFEAQGRESVADPYL